VPRIVRVLYRQGWLLFYIVTVTDSTCSASSLSRIVRVLIITVTDSTCSTSSLSRIVRVLYRQGWLLFYIVTVTDSTCSASSLSRLVRVLIVTVTDSTCSTSSLSRIVRVLYHHGWFLFYIVTVTDSTCSVLSVSRMNKTTLIHRFDQHSYCSSHGPHTSLPLGLVLRLFVVMSDFFLLQLGVSSVRL